MKTFFSMITIIFLSSFIYGQRGMLDNAVGLRLGLGAGVTFQHFTNNQNALEIIAYQRMGGVNLTVLFERHEKMLNIKGFRYFYGTGAHAWVFNKYNVLQENILRENSFALGVDAIVGMSYHLRSIPISISVDWKPSINLKGSHYIEWDSGGLSVRYKF